MSSQYISAFVVVAVAVFSMFGKNVDAGELTSIITSLVSGVAGIVIMVQRFKKGDINLLGGKK